MTTRLIAAFLLIVLMGGCEILGPDDDRDTSDRTYPEALDLPAADLQMLLDGVHDAGQFNLTAYVVNISECPPDYACLVADHIQVAGSPHTDGPSLMIAADKPSQFEVEGHYVLSIEVFDDAFPETNQLRFIFLRAWSEAD
jgi:hypothetical protein